MHPVPWATIILVLLLLQDPALVPAWKADLGERIIGPVIVEGDIVIAATRKGIVRGLAVETGEKKWEYDAAGPVGVLAAVRRRILVPRSDGKVVLLDPGTGKSEREFDVWPGAIPSVMKDRVYFGGKVERKESFNSVGASKQLLCLNIAKGKIEWTVDVKGGAGPAAEGGDRVYATDAGGAIVCLEAKTGKPVWTSADRMGMYGLHPPLVLKDRVIASGFGEGKVLCVDAKTGKKLWTWEPRGAVEAGQTSPILVEGRILVAALPAAALLDPATGKPDWTAEMGGHTMLVPAPANIDAGKAWFAYAGMVVSLEVASGRAVDFVTVNREAETWNSSSPTWSGGRLFVGMDSTLHALKPR